MRATMNATRLVSASLIERYYHTFNAGEREALLALLTDDVVHDINQGGSETGKPAFSAFLRRMERCYREQVQELVVMAAEDGARGAAEFFIEGTYLASDEGLPPAIGQTYRLRVGAFFELRDGLVARVTNRGGPRAVICVNGGTGRRGAACGSPLSARSDAFIAKWLAGDSGGAIGC